MGIFGKDLAPTITGMLLDESAVDYTSLLRLMKLILSYNNLKQLKVNEHPFILLYKPMVNCNSNLLSLNETCDRGKVIIIYNREIRHEESLEQTSHLQNSLVNERERQN